MGKEMWLLCNLLLLLLNVLLIQWNAQLLRRKQQENAKQREGIARITALAQASVIRHDQHMRDWDEIASRRPSSGEAPDGA